MARRGYLTTEQLGEQVIRDIAKLTLEEKARVRKLLLQELGPKCPKPRQANLSSMEGRVRHLHGLAQVALLIESEEKCFQEVWDFFENLKSEDVKYKM